MSNVVQAEASKSQAIVVPSQAKKPLSVAEKRRKEQKARVDLAAMELLAHFNYRNMDSIIKATRNTLEGMRRRIFSTLTIQFDKSKPRDAKPCFKAFATLSIPTIIMQPSVEEIQSALTKAVNLVTFVSKGVSQWNKQRKTVSRVVALILQPTLPAIADAGGKTATTLNKQPTAADAAGDEAAPAAAAGEPTAAGAAAAAAGEKAPEAVASGAEGTPAAAPAAAPAEGQPAGSAGDTAAAASGGESAGEAAAATPRERTQKKMHTHQAEAAPELQTIIVQARNYHRNVSENKEISKLITVLTSVVSSTKRVRMLFTSTHINQSINYCVRIQVQIRAYYCSTYSHSVLLEFSLMSMMTLD